jgi:hypothetical protein
VSTGEISKVADADKATGQHMFPNHAPQTADLRPSQTARKAALARSGPGTVADQDARPIRTGIREPRSNATFGIQLLAKPAPAKARPQSHAPRSALVRTLSAQAITHGQGQRPRDYDAVPDFMRNGHSERSLAPGGAWKASYRTRDFPGTSTRELLSVRSHNSRLMSSRDGRRRLPCVSRFGYSTWEDGDARTPAAHGYIVRALACWEVNHLSKCDQDFASATIWQFCRSEESSSPHGRSRVERLDTARYERAPRDRSGRSPSSEHPGMCAIIGYPGGPVRSRC